MLQMGEGAGDVVPGETASSGTVTGPTVISSPLESAVSGLRSFELKFKVMSYQNCLQLTMF